MGQKKIKTIDLNQSAKKAKDKKTVKKTKTDAIKKTNKKTKTSSDKNKKALTKEKTAVKKDKKVKTKTVEKKAKDKTTDKSKKAKDKKTVKKEEKSVKEPKQRSKRYKQLLSQVDRQKNYSLKQAVSLLLEIAPKKKETVELHLVVKNRLSGTFELPHGTGKEQKIEIASEKTLKKLAKDNIDFDLLISTPSMMPKLAKYARILGPKGLMPNPKNNTITDNPKQMVKKLEQGQVFYKTEPKANLVHLVIGKTDLTKEKILQNLREAVKAVKPKNILKAVLTSTQSPGIKLVLEAEK